VPAGQQVEVDDHEQIVERVAAIDVAKASGMVCIRVPHPAKPGRRVTKVWQVPATTNAIIELAEQLACQGIQRVVVESTSDYWRPFVYLLEARGLVVWLVNARDVKHLPGRPKTDKLDAVWLAKPQRAGHAATLVRPSGRDPPVAGLHPAAVRPDRRARPAGAAAGAGCRVDALIKLGTVATDIMGVSGRAMLEALIAGQRDPKVLAELARGRMRGKRGALVQALTGRFDDHHAELARMLLDHYDALTAQLDRLTARIQELIAAILAAQVPGDGDGAAGGSDDGTTGASANQRAAQPRLGRWSVWTSPAPPAAPAPPARATPTSRACSARSPPRPPRPTPSSANATAAWSGASASSRPWSLWPARSW
jgi:transposase